MAKESMKRKAAEKLRQDAIDYGKTMLNLRSGDYEMSRAATAIRDKAIVDLYETLASIAEALDLRTED